MDLNFHLSKSRTSLEVYIDLQRLNIAATARLIVAGAVKAFLKRTYMSNRYVIIWARNVKEEGFESSRFL
jgi:hypothetical protein